MKCGIVGCARPEQKRSLKDQDWKVERAYWRGDGDGWVTGSMGGGSCDCVDDGGAGDDSFVKDDSIE